MKASIKLVTTQKETANGYPICVYLRDPKFKQKFEVIGHSEKIYWNDQDKMITKLHPNYNLLITKMMEVHNNVLTVNIGSPSYDEAVSVLFGSKIEMSNQFYEAALKILTGKSASINKTVLNSFNNFYPGVSVDGITPEMVKNYMDLMLVKNKPNGVHTYLRKLDTLFGRVSKLPNPFNGIRPKKQKTQKKMLQDEDLRRIFSTRTLVDALDYKNTATTINHYRYYYMLMFYLGGIDIIDLANLRYDKHVIGGRVQFYRHKGGTDAFVSNKILPEALEILRLFDCKPYLVPIYKYKDHHGFVSNMNKRFYDRVQDLQLSRKPLTKSARYTFINRAQQLLIDQRITMEIVGHVQQDTHSIYTDHFPLKVRDEAHKRIIQL